MSSSVDESERGSIGENGTLGLNDVEDYVRVLRVYNERISS